MKSVTHLFADVTASLEDLHAIAIEGQSTSMSSDGYAALAALLDAGAFRLRDIVAEIRATLNG